MKNFYVMACLCFSVVVFAAVSQGIKSKEVKEVKEVKEDSESASITCSNAAESVPPRCSNHAAGGDKGEVGQGSNNSTAAYYAFSQVQSLTTTMMNAR